jgi:hypothetical protein
MSHNDNNLIHTLLTTWSSFMKKTLSIVILPICAFLSFVSAQEIIIKTTWGCLTWVWNECLVINAENDYTLESIAQDVIFAATYMLWTVLTLVIIYCWLWYIFAARWLKDVNKYKNWLKNAMIWAILVWWAYSIVRLIQYVAQW